MLEKKSLKKTILQAVFCTSNELPILPLAC